MTKTKLTKHGVWLFVGLMLTINTALTAQSLKIIPGSSTMTILGTTNVHDFQSKVVQMSGELIINSSKQVQSLDVVVPVRSIKSGEKLMDSKTYETFVVDKNPNITFHLTEASSLKVTDKDIEVTVTGNLTMAGVTKKISFKTTGKNTKPGVYQFKGSVPLKMTDFKMKPPTAMLGMMKVGDAITLKFDVSLSTPNMASIN